ncbi:UDP-N-acetylmuramate dehydrogenase [soil metagenome]
MTLADAFPAITRKNEVLAPYTHLRIGGPAEYFIQPRTPAELAAVLADCRKHSVPLRMLGGGFNLLVREDPIPGAVMQLQGDAFSFIRTDGKLVTAGGGTPLYDLIADTVRNGLGGLETLVGIRGSVGGSVRCNVGDRTGEIGASVRRVAVMTEQGMEQIRNRDELTFTDHKSDLDEPVILWVEFELQKRTPAVLMNRLKKAWMLRKQHEPLSFQSSVRMFRNPAGANAGSVIDRAGLAKFKIGGAELSERNANYVVAQAGTTSKDILGLIESVRTTVKDKTGINLDQELHVW